jgi:hypothetical protein
MNFNNIFYLIHVYKILLHHVINLRIINGMLFFFGF